MASAPTYAFLEFQLPVFSTIFYPSHPQSSGQQCGMNSVAMTNNDSHREIAQAKALVTTLLILYLHLTSSRWLPF